MGCTGSKEEAPAVATGGPTEAQKEAQRKFKEAQKKLEAEKVERKRQSLLAAQAQEGVLQQEADTRADEAGKEANEQAAAAIANQMAAELAEKQIEEARLADEAAKEEEQKNVMESFKGMGAKMRFRTATEKGMTEEAKEAAACMLQGAWRAKCAKRAVAVKKAEKKRLMESAMARKIQSLYRCRQARRKAVAKREEKKKIIADEEERRAAAAIVLAEKEAEVVEAEKVAAEAAAAADKEAADKEAADKAVAEKEAAEKAAAVSVADVAVAVGPPAMKSGMIKKEGSKVKNWKTRHFVLRSMSARASRLTYFEGPKTTEPYGTDEKGSVEITKATKLANETATTMTIMHPDGKSLKLEFLKSTDKSAWKLAFEEHIAYCK